MKNERVEQSVGKTRRALSWVAGLVIGSALLFGASGQSNAQAPEDLEALHQKMRPVFELNGVVFTDADERVGRLVVGVTNRGLATAVEARLKAAGVPLDLVDVVESEPILPMAGTLQDTVVRPLQGGTQIHFTNYLCTLGFNAVRNGVAGFVTNSHCTINQGGVDGTQYYQPISSQSGVVGQEIADPGYVSCANGKVCRYSDTSFAQYQNGVTGSLGTIAKTTGLGSLTISGTFQITGEGSASSGKVNKVGRTTGWTEGNISNTCVDTGVSGTNIVQLCQTWVTGTGTVVSPGDSGSPVFTISSGTDVVLQGILWGGSTDKTTFVYSPIANIERSGELGALTTYGSSGSDTTAPTVTSVSPANAVSGVAVGTNITVSFSEAVDPSTVTASTFSVVNGSTNVAGAITVAADGKSATLNPTLDLSGNTTYTVMVTSGVKDTAGNSLDQDAGITGSQPFSSSFTTAPAPPASSTVRVASISYSLSANKRNLKDSVRVVNSQGNAVSGAVVAIRLRNMTTNQSWTATGTTGSTGSVVFNLSRAPNGCYTTDITSLTASGLTWDGITPPNTFCK